jgi:hypothetical protein
VISRFMGSLWLTLLYFTVVVHFELIARFHAEHRPRGQPRAAAEHDDRIRGRILETLKDGRHVVLELYDLLIEGTVLD